MADTSPILSLPYLAPAQAQKHVTHNTALQTLDILVQLVVQGFDATVPPPVPAEGAVYATGVGATGAWAGQDNTLAAFTDGAWLFLSPKDGWRATEAATGAQRVWQNGAWADIPLDLDNLAGVGINAASDTTNRLSVSAPATLLNHAGAGHQLKLNKAATGDTASLLFQSNWSGRAEMGLAGEDTWSLKVSADGSAWATALQIDGATGAVGMGPDADTAYQFSVVAQTPDPTILVRNAGGAAGASFRMIDDASGGDWKFKTTSDASFKLRDQASGVDHVYMQKTTRCTDFAGAVRPASYTVATLPSASTLGAGALVFVTDETGGAVPAFSDGTDWRRMTDRAVVS